MLIRTPCFGEQIGVFDQGLAELKKARDLNPLSLIINTNLGLNLYWHATTISLSNNWNVRSNWSQISFAPTSTFGARTEAEKF